MSGFWKIGWLSGDCLHKLGEISSNISLSTSCAIIPVFLKISTHFLWNYGQQFLPQWPTLCQKQKMYRTQRKVTCSSFVLKGKATFFESQYILCAHDCSRSLALFIKFHNCTFHYRLLFLHFISTDYDSSPLLSPMLPWWWKCEHPTHGTLCHHGAPSSVLQTPPSERGGCWPFSLKSQNKKIQLKNILKYAYTKQTNSRDKYKL